MPSVLSVFPQELVDELISLGQFASMSAWRIGDITCQLVLHAQTGNTKFSKGEVQNAVARLTGKSKRTIRYYTDVAEFYPQVVRDAYANLPFYHFALARGDRWQEILEKSADHFSEYGAPMSFEALAKLAKPGGEDCETSQYDPVDDAVLEMDLRAAEVDDLVSKPEIIARLLEQAVELADALTGQLSRILAVQSIEPLDQRITLVMDVGSRFVLMTQELQREFEKIGGELIED